MSLKVKGTRLMVALFLCVSVLGQAPPGSRAAQRLEEYRQSKAAALRDDFGELVRYRAANASLKPAAPDEKRVVFFGDSITDMWNLAEYFLGKSYINRGIGGQTFWRERMTSPAIPDRCRSKILRLTTLPWSSWRKPIASMLSLRPSFQCTITRRNLRICSHSARRRKSWN